METTYHATPRDDRSIVELIKDLRDETTTLLKQEVELAKTEMSEKASRIGRNVGYLAAGGLVAYAGALFVLLGLSFLVSWGLEKAGLSRELALWLGPALVGLVVGIIGFVLVQKARRTLAQESLKPEITIQSLKEDKIWTQQKFQRT
jgi:uncharacterized membrane protein